jgi:phosphoribosylcarboxyaminoimidazole (NCAIR) mutase
MAKILIIMGSVKDLGFAKQIEKIAKKLGVQCELRIASAHKTPDKVIKIIKENEGKETVYVTIAGRKRRKRDCIYYSCG